jgi:carbamoyl-phosphate synthase large subunit
MAEVNVLLTCAGQRVDIVRAFQECLDDGPHHGRVLVSDSDPLSPSLFTADAVVDLPLVSEPGYGAAVAEVCRNEGVRAVLPLTDLDPVVLAEAAPLIRDAGAETFLPTPDIAAGCQDKWKCHEMLLAAGLPSPPTWLPDEVDHATLPFPVLVKPRIGFGARNIWRADDAAQLAFFLEYTPVESVIQQLCAGIEFSTDCLGDLQGRAIGAIPRAMLQAKGGEQIKGETLDDPALVELAARTVEALSLRGPSTVQCFRTDDSIVQGITDINTRFGGGFPLPHAAGGDYPGLIVRMAAGDEVEPRLGQHTAGVVMTRFLDQHILARENGRLGTALGGPARAAR